MWMPKTRGFPTKMLEVPLILETSIGNRSKCEPQGTTDCLVYGIKYLGGVPKIDSYPNINPKFSNINPKYTSKHNFSLINIVIPTR